MRVCVCVRPPFFACVRARLVSLYNSDDEADGIAIAPPGHQRRQAAPDAASYSSLVRFLEAAAVHGDGERRGSASQARRSRTAVE